MIDKRVHAMAEAMAGIKDGDTVLLGGFGSVGQPDALLDGLIETGARDLVVVANNAGSGQVGLARLMELRRVRRIICSFPRSQGSVVFEALYRAGEIELEIVPQGTLAERLRAGGAGIPAFYTPAGVGTQVADGGLPMLYGPGGTIRKASEKKDHRTFDGREYALEMAITGDFAIVKAWRGDRHGNLLFRESSRNFNPLCAMAAKVTIAEVEELVEPGELDPDAVHLPGIFVQRIVQGSGYLKTIENRTVRKRATAGSA